MMISVYWLEYVQTEDYEDMSNRLDDDLSVLVGIRSDRRL